MMSRCISIVLALMLAFASLLSTSPRAHASLQDEVELGEEVPVIAPDGSEVALVSVESIADPFTAYDPYDPPPLGYHYVLIEVVAEASGAAAIEVDPTDVVLRDVDGFVYGAVDITRDEGNTPPSLQTIQVAPGDRTAGAIGFQLLNTATLSQILLILGSGVAVTLLDFGTLPAAQIGDEIALPGYDQIEIAVVTATDVIDPFEEFAPDYGPQRGFHYVLIGIEIENTGERVFQVNPSYFYVQDEDGFVYYPQTIYRADETAMPELQYGDLAPGDTSTGSIGFVVPTDLAIVRVYYQPFDDLLLTLVDFEAQGGETSSVKPTPRVGATEEETPESADAEIDCDEVEDWLSFAFAEADAVQSIVGMLMVMRTEGDPGYAELAHEVSAAFEDSAERLLDYELDPAAAELNENLAEAFEEYGDATEDLATAVDEGDEDAIAEASEAVYDAEPDLITAIQAITALAEECDVV